MPLKRAGTSATTAALVFDTVITFPSFRLPNGEKMRPLNWYQTPATSKAVILQAVLPRSPLHPLAATTNNIWDCLKGGKPGPAASQIGCLSMSWSQFGRPDETTHSHRVLRLNQKKPDWGFETHPRLTVRTWDGFGWMELHMTVAVLFCFLLTGIFKIPSPALWDSFLTKLLPLLPELLQCHKDDGLQSNATHFCDSIF